MFEKVGSQVIPLWRCGGPKVTQLLAEMGFFVEIVDPFFFKISKCDPFTFPYLVALVLESCRTL